MFVKKKFGLEEILGCRGVDFLKGHVTSRLIPYALLGTCFVMTDTGVSSLFWKFGVKKRLIR